MAVRPTEAWSADQLLRWGTARRSMPGQQQSGDDALLRVTRRGVLVAVVDALGHGREAADAALLAITTLDRHRDESVIALLRHCHRALHGGRGAVMSLALFDATEGTMTWIGVGNVAGLLRPAAGAGGIAPPLTLVSRGGIVGANLPPLRAEVVTVSPGDLLVLATDGIGQEFVDGLPPNGTPQAVADRILRLHAKPSDDALVLVAQSCMGAAE